MNAPDAQGPGAPCLRQPNRAATSIAAQAERQQLTSIFGVP